MCAESEWLGCSNEVGIFQTSSITTRGSEVTSKWNGSFSATTDNQPTLSIGNTTMYKVSVSLGMRGIKMLDDHIPSQKYRDTGIFRDVISCRQLLQKYQDGQINLVTSDIASHLSSL